MTDEPGIDADHCHYFYPWGRCPGFALDAPDYCWRHAHRGTLTEEDTDG